MSDQLMLLNKLSDVEKLTTGSKLNRFLHHPVKYVFAQFIRKFFSISGKGSRKTASTFWHAPITVDLPAGTDIYLTGGKSHDSEIRLSKFLIRNLSEGKSFIDIGSHFGFFTMLAQECIKGSGKILSIEPSENSFNILRQNLPFEKNMHLIKALVGEETCKKEFFEFPLLYSEYNTIYPEQFDGRSWYKKIKIKKQMVSCFSLDDLFREHEINNAIVKIDTEGAELNVIKGAITVLQTHHDTIFVMEYLNTHRGNESHRQAAALLADYGYYPFIINHEGELITCNNIDMHLDRMKVDSDNIVFRHKASKI